MLRKFVAVAVLGLLPAIALAQHPQPGDWEITLGGSGSNNPGFTAGSFAVNGSLGYFLTKNFEVALRQGVSYSDFNAGTSWNGATRVAVDFHFDLGAWQPFIGGNIGWVYGQAIKDTWEVAPEIGVKYFVHDKTFVYGMAEYEYFFSHGNSNNGFDNGSFVYSLGIGFLLP